MTFLLYIAWFASLLLVAGEIDRVLSHRFVERVLPELSNFSVWFLPPAGSAFLPGAGQVLNGQPLKGLLALSWPIAVGLIPRPWQFLMLHTYVLLAPWWVIVVLDALVVGLIRHRQLSLAERPDRDRKARETADLSEFLNRRASQQPGGRP